MSRRAVLFVAGLSGFLGVALGAFGAHMLKGVLDAQRMAVWNTAVLYHLIHSPVLLWLAGRQTLSALPLILFVAGAVLFSGSLYALALTNLHLLGAITPVGGLLLMAGWGWVAFFAYRAEGAEQ